MQYVGGAQHIRLCHTITRETVHNYYIYIAYLACSYIALIRINYTIYFNTLTLLKIGLTFAQRDYNVSSQHNRQGFTVNGILHVWMVTMNIFRSTNLSPCLVRVGRILINDVKCKASSQSMLNSRMPSDH